MENYNHVLGLTKAEDDRRCNKYVHHHERACKLYRLAWEAGAWANDALTEADWAH